MLWLFLFDLFRHFFVINNPCLPVSFVVHCVVSIYLLLCTWFDQRLADHERQTMEVYGSCYRGAATCHSYICSILQLLLISISPIVLHLCPMFWPHRPIAFVVAWASCWCHAPRLLYQAKTNLLTPLHHFQYVPIISIRIKFAVSNSRCGLWHGWINQLRSQRVNGILLWITCLSGKAIAKLGQALI